LPCLLAVGDHVAFPWVIPIQPMYHDSGNEQWVQTLMLPESFPCTMAHGRHNRD
jgi:hypothetical protein